MVRMHKISSIGSLTVDREKNQVSLEINRYMKHLNWEATNDDLEVSTEKMQKYISGPVIVKTMLRMLQDELEKGSQIIYPQAMEARVHFQKDTIK